MGWKFKIHMTSYNKTVETYKVVFIKELGEALTRQMICFFKNITF